MNRYHSRGFMLVELLVVIAVIGLLAGLLFPALRSARQKADTAKCANHLRQLGQATLMYCQDSDDYLPFAWYNDGDASANNFHGLLMPLMYRCEFDGYGDFEYGVFACPTRLKEPLVGSNPFKISYGMNAYNAVKYPEQPTRRIGQVTNSSLTVLMADIDFRFNHPAIRSLGPDQVGYKHTKKANILFFDGHVAAYAQAETGGMRVGF